MEANWEKPPTPLQQAERDNTGNRYAQTMGGGVFFLFFYPSCSFHLSLKRRLQVFCSQPFGRKVRYKKERGNDPVGLASSTDRGGGGPQASFGTANPWVRFGRGKRLLTQQLCIAPAKIQPTQQTVLLLLNSEGKWMVFVESFCPRTGVCTTGETRHPSLGGGGRTSIIIRIIIIIIGIK